MNGVLRPCHAFLLLPQEHEQAMSELKAQLDAAYQDLNDMAFQAVSCGSTSPVWFQSCRSSGTISCTAGVCSYRERMWRLRGIGGVRHRL